MKVQSENCDTLTHPLAAPGLAGAQAWRLIISRRHPFSLVNGSGLQPPDTTALPMPCTVGEDRALRALEWGATSENRFHLQAEFRQETS